MSAPTFVRLSEGGWLQVELIEFFGPSDMARSGTTIRSLGGTDYFTAESVDEFLLRLARATYEPRGADCANADSQRPAHENGDRA